MAEIKLTPVINAAGLPGPVEEELTNNEVSTHYNHGMAIIDNWDKTDENDPWTFPKFKAWLVETYGEEIKQYKHFGVIAT